MSPFHPAGTKRVSCPRSRARKGRARARAQMVWIWSPCSDFHKPPLVYSGRWQLTRRLQQSAQFSRHLLFHHRSGIPVGHHKGVLLRRQSQKGPTPPRSNGWRKRVERCVNRRWRGGVGTVSRWAGVYRNPVHHQAPKVDRHS